VTGGRDLSSIDAKVRVRSREASERESGDGDWRRLTQRGTGGPPTRPGRLQKRKTRPVVKRSWLVPAGDCVGAFR
jgi:hypothetical protein